MTTKYNNQNSNTTSSNTLNKIERNTTNNTEKNATSKNSTNATEKNAIIDTQNRIDSTSNYVSGDSTPSSSGHKFQDYGKNVSE